MNRLRAVPILLCAVSLTLRADGAPPDRRLLTLTQVPAAAATNAARPDRHDLLYPIGSRIVIGDVSSKSEGLRILSAGLSAAGNPVVSFDGKTVYFMGKSSPSNPWQIYKASVSGGGWVAVTSLTAGAMDPALLPGGELVFASPANRAEGEPKTATPPQLFAQTTGEKPRQLTFAPGGARSPTVLADGRILFVSTAENGPSSSVRQSLYTVNNDGTEFAAFALQHGPAVQIDRPRELVNGRIGFVAINSPSGPAAGAAQYVQSARPFAPQAPVLPDVAARICSIQPDADGNLLICAEHPTAAGAASWCLFGLSPLAHALGNPLLCDSAWNTVEAVPVTPTRRPMGRITTMDPSRKTGQILCLNANDTTYRPTDGQSIPTAIRMRVLVATANGSVRPLGEVQVQADGSFMAEVPADVPLGFEALDSQGQVLRRVDPLIWVRSGENRSCTGCHAPHNRAPHNHRPLAVRAQVPRLCDQPESNPVVKTPHS